MPWRSSRTIFLRRARQHDGHAASAIDGVELQGSAQRDFATSRESRRGGDHLLRLRRERSARAQGNGERSGKRISERFYAVGFEVFREFGGSEIALEHETLHIRDDKQRIALIETKTIEDGDPNHAPTPKQRYQLTNHQSSASVEVDEAGGLITYEEYSPYGDTTYQAATSAGELRRKRYRYTSKERDRENGFTYHGARYYAPWLGRWTACDPKGTPLTTNLYEYCKDDPVGMLDPNGEDGESWLSRARDYARSSAVGQGLLGVVYGTTQALTPFGGFAPPPPGTGQAFQVGQGLAQLAVGVVETYGGSALVTGGAGLAGIGGIGEVGTGGAATPVAIPAIVVGAGAVTTGIVVVAHGGKNVLGGLTTLQNAMHNSEGPPSEPSPSTQSPSETPQPAPKPPKAPEVPKPATPNEPSPTAADPKPAAAAPETATPASPPESTGGTAGPKTSSNPGRAGKQQRLNQLAEDPNTSSADRGWIKQEQNAIERGQRTKSVIHPESSLRTHEGGRQQKVTVMWSHLRTFRTRIFTRPNTSSTTTAGETRSDHENDTPKRN